MRVRTKLILVVFLLAVVPQLPGLTVAVHMQTATEVGGDYYDLSKIKGKISKIREILTAPVAVDLSNGPYNQ